MEHTKTNLTLLEVQSEAGNVKTFSFNPNGLTWIPGQYQEYVLPIAGADAKENEHYFTIASAPNEQRINISTRISESAFKQALNALKPGDTIEAHGPKGDFLWEETDAKPIILVAAGIGVTPYRSMLLERAANGLSLNATLIYFNRNDEIPFLDTFKQLAATHAEFTLQPIIGEPVTAEKILELAPDAQTGTLYLSGPEPMVDTIGEALKTRGVALKQDWFPGYTQATF